MRIGLVTGALIITTVHLLYALPSEGQPIDQVKIKMELNHASLIQAFQKIEMQSNFHFMYRYNEVKDVRDLNIPASVQSVEQFLKAILAVTPLTYRQVSDQILIIPSRSISVDSSLKGVGLFDAPDAGLVKGNVANANGDPLVGVSITVKGKDGGTSSDEKGNYSITVPDNGVLVFSYIGYTPQEINVGDQTTINVRLQEASRALNEVVVTAMGIKRQSKSLTYSTQTLKGEKLAETKDVSMINSLQGKVAGLTITRNPNGPGSNSNVLLRGNRSITGNNAPLYVTDGVPGSVGMEDGDNIESITVLKGASAAALYGSAGQNGAIIITTKKGIAGKISVEYNGGFAVDKAAIYQKLQYDYGQGDADMYVANSEHSFGPKNTGQSVALWDGTTVPLAGQPDRFQDFFRTGQTLNNSISVTSGNDKMQTYFSYGNIQALGIMRNNSLTRHIFNLKITNNITSKLSFDTKVTYINETTNNPPNDYAVSSIYRTPTSIPLSAMENYEYLDEDRNLRQNYWKPGSSILGNPFFYMYRNPSTSRDKQLTGLFSAKYSFSNSIDLMVRGSIVDLSGNTEDRIFADSYYSLVGSNLTLTNGNELRGYADVLLTFKHNLSKNFTISGNVGASVQGSKSDSLSVNANGLVKENFFYMTNAKSPQVISTIAKAPSVQAIYAEATLGYKNYLFLDVTARNDWSSALPKGSNSIYYPSAGLTAVVSDMVQLPSWITYGKARVSLANSGYGGNAYLGQQYYSVAPGGLVSRSTIQSLGDYKPELTTSLEAGLDWRFFNNRLGFDLTYYRTKTKNQLLLIGAPPASTYDLRYINAGLIQNSGIELITNITPIRAGKFAWDVMFNYSKNNNKVIQLTDAISSVIIQDDDLVTTMVEVGQSFGNLYAKGWQRDAEGHKLVDDIGRPLLTSGKTVLVGNYNPNYMMGLSNTFTYSNISLSFLIDYRNGGTILGGTQALIDADGHSERSLEGRESGIVLDAYGPDGKPNTQSISSQGYFSSIGDRKPAGEEYAYSATNMRLRELTLGYTFPRSLFGSSKYIKGMKIAFVGRNLFFFQKSTPFDPDIAQGRGGIESSALPFTRTLGVNLRVSF